jgi:GNAT superfamily N-acetyltransferase
MDDNNRHISPGHLSPPTVRPASPGDRDWIVDELTRNWGGVEISSLDVWYRVDELPALVACVGADRVGLVTHTIPRTGEGCEVLTLSSRLENAGIGTMLLDAAAQRARLAGCRRVFLTTTNDNLRAIGFYQRRGWSMVAVHRGAMDRARAVKPSIPLMGMNNIPLHDEIEFELLLR